jgi:hypothetical protein
LELGVVPSLHHVLLDLWLGVVPLLLRVLLG